MEQQLRLLAAPSQGQTLDPSTHLKPPVTITPRDLMPFLASMYTQRYINKINIFEMVY